jgi:hypothetical protein
MLMTALGPIIVIGFDNAGSALGCLLLSTEQ